MGKGERCGGRAGSQFTEKANQQTHHAQSKLEFRLDRGASNQIEVPSDLEMTMKLSRRPQRNAKATNELNRRTEGVSFNHVGGYRYRSATDLIREPEVAAQRLLKGEPIRRPRQLVRRYPRLKGCQLFHGGIIDACDTLTGTRNPHGGTETCSPALPFPFPHSPFPGV